MEVAWAYDHGDAVANETRVAIIDCDGTVTDAGWTRGKRIREGAMASTFSTGDSCCWRGSAG
jgi:hypothetical protein